MASSSLPPRGRPHAAAVRHLRQLAQAARYVDTHLDTALDAATLAGEAAMSRHHFHRLFHAHLGLTVGSYILWRRLQQACTQLRATRTPVLEIALSVGFGSAQALAKAMQRELGLTPSAVRAGQAVSWPDWLTRQHLPQQRHSTTHPRPPLVPQWRQLPALPVLAASGWGMQAGDMTAAVQQGFRELVPALEAAALMPQVSRCLSLLLDTPRGPDDPRCQMLTGAVFGYDPQDGSGHAEQPTVACQGSLQWLTLPAGNHAVFLHCGPHQGLADTWDAIYRHWLPAAGQCLRDAPAFDLYLNDPRTTAPALVRTALYLPLA